MGINPGSASFRHQEGTGTVAVTAPAGCAWTAVSRDSWIVVTSGATGSGNGTVGFSVERLPPGPAGQRTGTIRIGGQTFTIHQERGA